MRKYITIYLVCILMLLGCIGSRIYAYKQQTWAKCIGGTSQDVPYSMIIDNEGNYVICGLSYSFKEGEPDAWIVKLDLNANIIWQLIIGGNAFDSCNSIIQATNGNYIIAGATWSLGSGSSDYLVAEISTSGTLIWTKAYGGSGYDFAHSIKQTSDGGYITIGRSWSFNSSDGDIWIVKLNSEGNIEWQTKYGGNKLDTSYSIIQTFDGGYITAAGSWSMNAGSSDIVLIKLNYIGNIEWQRAYSGIDFDYPYSIIQSSDGGYLISGATKSFGSGDTDGIVIKTDNEGNIEWQKVLGGQTYDYLYSIKQSADGGYISIGKTNSFGACNYDILIVKFNSSGDIINQKVYGGVGDDDAYSILELSNGEYIISGISNSYGLGGYDFLILKTNNLLEIESCNIFADVNLSIFAIDLSPQNSSLIATQTNGITNAINIASENTNTVINSICPPQPILFSFKPVVNDEGSDTANGMIEPDEVVILKGMIANRGSSLAQSITATLTTLEPIEIIQGNTTYPDTEPYNYSHCIECYILKAPLSNRTSTHWDFEVDEQTSCNDCNSFLFPFKYHVANSFTDVVAKYLFYPYIETIFHYNITGGCTNTQYCPLAPVLRQQMAKFICRAMNVAKADSCLTNPCQGIFADMPSNNIFCSDVEALYKLGIVSGCGNDTLRYCPNQETKRQVMAKFICTAKEYISSGSCTLAPCEGLFEDVPSSNPFCSYIEALYNQGILSGCTTSSYCHYLTVSRAQMSKFLKNAFDL